MLKDTYSSHAVEMFCFMLLGLVELTHGKNIGHRLLNKWNELKLSLLAHLCIVQLK